MFPIYYTDEGRNPLPQKAKAFKHSPFIQRVCGVPPLRARNLYKCIAAQPLANKNMFTNPCNYDKIKKVIL